MCWHIHVTAHDGVPYYKLSIELKMVNKADKNPGTVSGESMWVEKKKKKKGEDPVSKRFL